jgi:hypothetical protein
MKDAQAGPEGGLARNDSGQSEAGGEGVFRWAAPDIRAFRERFATNANARRDPLYALPSTLLDAIEGALPGWLGDEEIEFERALCGLCECHQAVGLAGDRILVHNILRRSPLPSVSRALFEELGWGRYMTYEGMTRSLQRLDERVAPVHDRQEAYLGWLTTNSDFLGEVSGVVSREDAAVGEHGRIDPSTSLVREFGDFCRRWQLYGMVTWELPLPQGPDLTGVPRPQQTGPAQTDAQLVIPVTLPLPTRYPLREIIAEIQRRNTPDHLKRWQDVLRGDDERGTGLRRYASMFRLRFYRDIVLSSRYGERFHRRVQPLDEAFGRYFGSVGEESVKRLRLAINRRLRR